MFFVDDLKVYSASRQKAEDERWLGETKTAIKRTAIIRDQLGELVPKHKDMLLHPAPVIRPYVRLQEAASRPGMEADPKRLPLQRAQFQILVESARNIWIAENKKPDDSRVSRWVRDLSYIDASLLATRPIDRNEMTYETWWRKAMRALPGDQYKMVTDGLADMEGYFSTHCSHKVAEVLNKSATLLMGQMAFSRLPTMDEKRGSFIIKVLRKGFSIMDGLGLPASIVGKVGKELLPDDPLKIEHEPVGVEV